MSRLKPISSVLLHRGGSCSLFHLRLPSRTYCQLPSLPNLGKQASLKCWPHFLELQHHILGHSRRSATFSSKSPVAKLAMSTGGGVAYRLTAARNGCAGGLLTSITSNFSDPVKRFITTGGIAAAAAFACSSSGYQSVIHCQEISDDSPSAQDHYIDWDEDGRAPLFFWLRRLWVPLLMVMTVAMGWHYPLSLGINLVFLLWSTKPTPSSIYIWVEQKRLQAAQRMHGLGHLKAQLSNASMMMRVEVQDYGVACVARVSSLTQKMLVIGVLGDWWVLYSYTSSFSGFNLGSWFPMSPLNQW